jgi:protein-S-isoprenylcysteine O-methyltransferase Ste14
VSDNEIVFRIAVAALIGAWSVTRVYFQRRLGAVERVRSHHDRRERLAYALVGLSFVPPLVYAFSPWLDLFHFLLPDLWRGLGAVLGLAGVGLFGWTHHALGKNWSGVLEISKNHRLVAEGPYRIVRHPMYSAFFLMVLGVLLLSANVVAGGGLLAAVTFMYLQRVSDEEAMMLEQFGEPYRRYMHRTGRLLPRFRSARA